MSTQINNPVVTKEISVKGTVVYWTLGNKTDAEFLKTELEFQNLERFAPDKNTKRSSLKIALDRVCGSRRRLIRPLVGERGYAVVNESKNESGASLEHNISFDAILFDDADWPIFRDPNTGTIINPPEESAILHRYQNELDRCASHKLGISLARIVDHFHGVSLRPTGGFYWIPEAVLPKFETMAQSVRQSASDGSNIIFSLRTAMNDELKEAVVSGLRRELSAEMETMEEDVMSGDLGKRALKTKQERCEKLRKRVSGYKNMFQVALTELEEALDKVESAVAVSALAGLGT